MGRVCTPQEWMTNKNRLGTLPALGCALSWLKKCTVITPQQALSLQACPTHRLRENLQEQPNSTEPSILAPAETWICHWALLQGPVLTM